MIFLLVGEILALRPPWLPPDKTPRDLDPSRHSMIADFDPNDPTVRNLLNSARSGTAWMHSMTPSRRVLFGGNEFENSLKVIEMDVTKPTTTQHRLVVVSTHAFRALSFYWACLPCLVTLLNFLPYLVTLLDLPSLPYYSIGLAFLALLLYWTCVPCLVTLLDLLALPFITLLDLRSLPCHMVGLACLALLLY